MSYCFFCDACSRYCECHVFDRDDEPDCCPYQMEDTSLRDIRTNWSLCIENDEEEE